MLSLQKINAKLYDPDRTVRAAAAAGLTQGLKDNARLLTYILNTLVQDHRSDCELRHHQSVMAPRHLANEIDGAVVDALMTATERHHAMVHAAYYRLKGKLLGLEQLRDYDRYAPLFSDQPLVDWQTARGIVETSYEAFSPRAGEVIRQFFDRAWIDAELRSGKRGGAFSASTVPNAPPLYPDELHGQIAARRDDAGPRTGPRVASGTYRGRSATCSATRR